MQLRFKQPLPATPDQLMRAAGYSFWRDPHQGKESYVRRVHGSFYPRFHVYVKEADGLVVFDLHLDQKKPSYRGSSAHAGEYDGPVVEAELARMRQAFQVAARRV